MPATLYAHPFSSYCQKVLIALYENATPFSLRMLASEEAMAELAALWPLRRFPVLVEDDRTILEASIIIEHLQLAHRGPVRLIPAEPRAALEVRMLDRLFDNYIMTPTQTLVIDRMRPEAARDPHGTAAARAMLDSAYGWFDQWMTERHWAAGESFSLADCAAGPSLFYADWAHPIDAGFAALRAYRARLLARPSFARVIEEARPYRGLFPLGAPDRD
jgi:glutathione S-transferase